MDDIKFITAIGLDAIRHPIRYIKGTGMAIALVCIGIYYLVLFAVYFDSQPVHSAK